MEKNMEKEFIIIILEENTRVSGSMIKSMDMESLIMSMVTNTKDIGKMGKDPVKVFTNIQMGTYMKVNGYLT